MASLAAVGARPALRLAADARRGRPPTRRGRSQGGARARRRRARAPGFLQALVERFEAGAVRDRVAGAIERRLQTVLGR